MFTVHFSMVQSREQWDFPNAWPPLMHMVNESLRLSNDKDLQSAGFEIAQKWVNYNFETFNEYGTMFEKYEVTGKCKAGVGGEYTVQVSTSESCLNVLYRVIVLYV